MSTDTPLSYRIAVDQLRVRLSPEILGRIQAVYSFHFKDDGTTATLDGSTADGLGYVEDEPEMHGLTPDFEITLTREDFARLLSGQLHPMAGMATGRMKLKGDMREAIKLDRLLKA